MNKKIIFRILGALSSALIIVGVFVPFVSASGHSQTLWDTYNSVGTLYLPIMIIVFGVIGVLFFSLNIKTEFAYMSTGAITFFIIMQTLDFVEQKMFSSLSMGYYFLAIGAILTGIMAFLCNLRVKKKAVVETNQISTNQPSMLDQIDKLYNVQPQSIDSVPSMQPANNPINEIAIQPIQPIQEIQPIEPVQTSQVQVQPEQMQSLQQTVQPASQPNVGMEMSTQQQIQPIVQPVQAVPLVVPQLQPMVNETMPQMNQNLTNVSMSVNPVVQQFSQSETPTMQEFGINNVQLPQSVNNESQLVEQPEVSIPNPVVQEFSNTQSSSALTNQATNNSGLDIFGQ